MNTGSVLEVDRETFLGINQKKVLVFSCLFTRIQEQIINNKSTENVAQFTDFGITLTSPNGVFISNNYLPIPYLKKSKN
jgi:hypothetical protein